MTIAPRKPLERPSWIPPFVWSALGADADPASQVASLANPLGIGPVGMVRVISAAEPRIVEFTGRDLRKRLVERLGEQFRPIVENAVRRKALHKLAETDDPLTARAVDSLRAAGSAAWQQVQSLPTPALGQYHGKGRTILAASGYPGEDANLTLAHELLHAAEKGVWNAGDGSDPGWNAAINLYRLYGSRFAPIRNNEEAAVELGARKLLGQNYATRANWDWFKPQVDQWLAALLARY